MATYRPIVVVEFLADAEAGRAQLDWHKDAEQSSRRERRRKREMKVAFDELGAALKALGKLSSDDPSPEALAEGVIIAQPEQIHLTPSEDDWPSEPARARAVALLAAEGFQPIGRFAIREMPGLRLEAYYHPGEHLDAVIYDAAGQSGVDLVRFAADGTMLTVTSNVTRPEAHFEMPGRRMIRLPGAPLADLLRTLRADPEPPSGLAPAPPDEFVKRFEAAHRREARALKQQVRRKARKK